MVRIKPYITLIFILIFASSFAQNNAGEIKTKIDTTRISIGDHFNIDITLKLPLNATAYWPVFADTLSSKIEVIKTSKIDTTRDSKFVTFHQKITLTSFDSGQQVIPAIRLEASFKGDTNKQSYYTDILYMNVYAPAIDTTKAIKDIKEIISAPYTWQEILQWILWGVLAILVISGIIFIILRYKNKKPIFNLKPKPTIPPHTWALAEFETLRKEKLWQSGLTKQYYTRITDTLRKYLELSNAIQAMEMTSDEIYAQLTEKSYPNIVISNFKNILTIADYVKFAKMDPLPEDHENCLSQAIEIINKTTPKTNPIENQ